MFYQWHWQNQFPTLHNSDNKPNYAWHNVPGAMLWPKNKSITNPEKLKWRANSGAEEQKWRKESSQAQPPSPSPSLFKMSHCHMSMTDKAFQLYLHQTLDWPVIPPSPPPSSTKKTSRNYWIKFNPQTDNYLWNYSWPLWMQLIYFI